uniref:AlNc14C349G10891 protein n=1 Tax=Albugo laibachii Nc14 TaxID=890382 RepID=F0WXD9_9STRA|nr:AlNc14C349G10891 [Albugo laibachii Nc14]|eukprot:CCA26131.1 AlNc14C349G10891 [Albugo laibachii Nc14]
MIVPNLGKRIYLFQTRFVCGTDQCGLVKHPALRDWMLSISKVGTISISLNVCMKSFQRLRTQLALKSERTSTVRKIFCRDRHTISPQNLLYGSLDVTYCISNELQNLKKTILKIETSSKPTKHIHENKRIC